MRTLYKRWLIMGLSLSIFALSRLRRTLETQLEGVEEGKVVDSKPVVEPESQPVAVLPVAANAPVWATTVTFSGTVIRNGGRFALRETGGVLYTLDSTGRAWPFEGEDVRVTGKLDTSTRLLHVDDIEAMAS